MPKPRIFVASSTERAQIAKAIQRNLAPYATVTLWPRIFGPSRYALESLELALPAFDAGAFVLAPDDVVTIRKRQHHIARDNVIFELGLFVGALGRMRSFLVAPKDAELHLPTDLLGLTPAWYTTRRDRKWTAALEPACTQIRQALTHAGTARYSGIRIEDVGTFGDFSTSFDRLL